MSLAASDIRCLVTRLSASEGAPILLQLHVDTVYRCDTSKLTVLCRQADSKDEQDNKELKSAISDDAATICWPLSIEPPPPGEWLVRIAWKGELIDGGSLKLFVESGASLG